MSGQLTATRMVQIDTESESEKELYQSQTCRMPDSQPICKLAGQTKTKKQTAYRNDR